MKKSFPMLILIIFFSSSTWAGDFSEALRVIGENKCNECHELFQKGPESLNKGPHLFFAGNKFNAEWLVDFLLKPETIRIGGYITDPGFLIGQPEMVKTHPTLSKNEGKIVAKYLMSLKLEGLKSGIVDSAPLSKGQKVKAKIIFERDYGCTACHKGINLARKPKGGISGPTLVNAGDRLNPDWIFHWLKNPKNFLDRGRMPAYKLDDATTIQIVKYLMTLKKESLR